MLSITLRVHQLLKMLGCSTILALPIPMCFSDKTANFPCPFSYLNSLSIYCGHNGSYADIYLFLLSPRNYFLFNVILIESKKAWLHDKSPGRRRPLNISTQLTITVPTYLTFLWLNANCQPVVLKTSKYQEVFIGKYYCNHTSYLGIAIVLDTQQYSLYPTSQLLKFVQKQFVHQ